ncbi:MAG TPA: tripartite tricarboxylate transporter substrate binding protein [Ramlibacter sp.]|nr:tripartite tricarboxylate transporter substrate binding protein [Ramlibacter sp.]
MLNMRALKLVGAALASLLLLTSVQAQQYPTRPIRIINPYQPGGTGDVIIRPIAEKLAQALGQPVLVENKPGSNGILGASTVAKAAPDGYTLLLSDAGAIAISQALTPKPPYDSQKDLKPITQLIAGPTVLIVRPDLPVKTFKDLLEYAKRHPGKVTYGSVGPGSPTHLAGAMLEMMGGVNIVHVPYKGSAQVLTDMRGGHIDMAFMNIAGALPHIQAGNVRALAVTTLKRSTLFPELPAVNEVFPGYEVNSWWGLMAPAGTPPEVVARLYAEVNKIVRQPEISERHRQSGLETEGSTPDQYGARIRDDIARWTKVVRATGVSAN